MDHRAKDDHREVPSPLGVDKELGPISPGPRLDSDVDFREPTMPPWRFWLLSVGVSLGLFLSMIDASIVATSLYKIAIEFEAIEDINWVALAYTLSYLAFSVVFSRISDVIGRKNSFMVAYLIFFSFSLACGFAQNFRSLVAFRTAQGIGGSGLYSLTMIILPELSPPYMRPQIAALIGMVIAISGVMGPVIGGLLVKELSWRWSFWINGPVGFISIALFFFTWPNKAEWLPNIERRSWKEIDYLGSFLTVSSSTLMVFAFQDAGGNRSWGHALFIAPLLFGIASWIALIVWERYIERQHYSRFAPAFPLVIFRNRVFSTSCLNTFLLGFPYLLLVYTVPMRIQIVGGRSPLMAGVMLLPMLGTVALGSIIAGGLNSKKNYVFETLLAGSAFMLIGCACLTTLSHELDEAKLLGFLVFIGLGFGLTVSVSTMLSGVEVPIREFAPSQGILSQLRIFGGSLGIAASTAILDQKLSATDEPAVLAGGTSLTHIALTEAFRTDMIVGSVVSALALITTIGSFRRHHPSIPEQRNALVEEETIRRRREAEAKRASDTS